MKPSYFALALATASFVALTQACLDDGVPSDPELLGQAASADTVIIIEPPDANLETINLDGAVFEPIPSDAGVFVPPPPPPPPPPSPYYVDPATLANMPRVGSCINGAANLPVGGSLRVGQAFRSCDGQSALVLFGDGNLVLLRVAGRLNVAWTSGTAGSNATNAVMQRDGNFVLYDAAGRARWSTLTYNKKGASLGLQNDGRLQVVFRGAVVWSN